MSFRDRHEPSRDDRWEDRRQYTPHKRSADDFRSSESDHKRNKANRQDHMDIDYHIDKSSTLPKHLKYLMDSDKELTVYSSKSYELELGLGSDIRKLEFELLLTELEVEKWENQIVGMEQTLKEIEEF